MKNFFELLKINKRKTEEEKTEILELSVEPSVSSENSESQEVLNADFPVKDSGIMLKPTEEGKFIWNSFRFSQGSVKFQLLLLCIAKKFYPTRVDIDSPEMEGIINNIFKLTQLINNKVHTQPLLARDSDQRNQFRGFWKLFRENKSIVTHDYYGDENHFNMPTEIAKMKIVYEEFLERDYIFLIVRNGRPNRTGEKSNDSLADKFSSYFVTYILRKKETGDPFFDYLFSVLNKNVAMWFTSEDLENKQKFVDMVNLYNKHHNINPVTKKELEDLGFKL